MKKFHFLLIFSVCVVATAILWLRPRGGYRPSSGSTMDSPSEMQADLSVATNSAHSGARAFSWHDVESSDYRVYVQKLRKIGCPESTIEDIVVADVNALFLEKAKPLLDDIRQSFLRFYKAPQGSADKKLAIANAK